MIKMDYFNTYYFCNVCDTIINNTFEYATNLDSLWGNGNFSNFLTPFSKYSVLHQYIEFCIEGLIWEPEKDLSELTIEDMKKRSFWINKALDYHQMNYQSFSEYLEENNIDSNKTLNNEDFLNDYLTSIRISEEFQNLFAQMVSEVFYILFLNRGFLYKFNSEFSGMFKTYKREEFNEDVSRLLKNNGTLYRKHIPKWVERAVFYRDRGVCNCCKKDLSGLVNIQNKYNIDHIIPLAKHGLNDISNLQLLCNYCNNSKGIKLLKISNDYQNWY